jgi:hypothetical protein
LNAYKRTISHSVKDGSGAIHAKGTIPPHTLGPGPLDENTTATVDCRDGSPGFCWVIYDLLKPHAGFWHQNPSQCQGIWTWD